MTATRAAPAERRLDRPVAADGPRPEATGPGRPAPSQGAPPIALAPPADPSARLSEPAALPPSAPDPTQDTTATTRWLSRPVTADGPRPVAAGTGVPAPSHGPPPIALAPLPGPRAPLSEPANLSPSSPAPTQQTAATTQWLARPVAADGPRPVAAGTGVPAPSHGPPPIALAPLPGPRAPLSEPAGLFPSAHSAPDPTQQAAATTRWLDRPVAADGPRPETTGPGRPAPSQGAPPVALAPPAGPRAPLSEPANLPPSAPDPTQQAAATTRWLDRPVAADGPRPETTGPGRPAPSQGAPPVALAPPAGPRAPLSEPANLSPNAPDADPGRRGATAARRAAPAERRLDSRAPARPLRLFPRPEPVDAVAEVPDGAPLRFRWRHRTHAVAHAEGPERIAMPWWRAADLPLTRDYFRVETTAGQRFWLFRAGLFGSEVPHPRWFLHGIFG